MKGATRKAPWPGIQPADRDRVVAFHGKRTEAGCVVRVELHDGARFGLPSRLDLRRHSPSGFEWGYGGSGPSQLALAMLAAVTTDTEAKARYQGFKLAIVSCIPRPAAWCIEADAVRGWLDGDGEMIIEALERVREP